MIDYFIHKVHGFAHMFGGPDYALLALVLAWIIMRITLRVIRWIIKWITIMFLAIYNR